MLTQRPRRAGGGRGLPDTILPEQGVEQVDELAHDGGDRDLMGLAPGSEAFVADLEGGFAADRGRSGHVQQMAWVGATAADGPATAVLAGVAAARGEAE